MAKKEIKKELEVWLAGDVETAGIELKNLSDSALQLSIGDEHEFTVSFPNDYPKSKDKLAVSSEDSSLAEWIKDANKYSSKPNIKLSDLLTHAAEKFVEMGEEEEEEEEEEEMEDEMLGLERVEEKKVEKKKPKDEEVDTSKFMEIGSPTATLRLIKDLKNVQNVKKDMGFSAAPVADNKTGLENLYHWHIKLFGFDKDSEIGKDMITYQKKTAQDHILVELRFSKDYPFAPPFVRVVKPRFAFRTGHVTIGGSICMELLTNSGWNSTNDIESILIQIRAEMTGGGARLDAGMSNTYEYTETEAWDAFSRAAATHGWNINGLSKNTYTFY